MTRASSWTDQGLGAVVGQVQTRQIQGRDAIDEPPATVKVSGTIDAAVIDRSYSARVRVGNRPITLAGSSYQRLRRHPRGAWCGWSLTGPRHNASTSAVPEVRVRRCRIPEPSGQRGARAAPVQPIMVDGLAVRYSSAGGGRLRRKSLRIRQGRRPGMGQLASRAGWQFPLEKDLEEYR